MTDAVSPPVTDAAFGDDWWQRGVVYQVYPRSLQDTNGDGIGDLPGITERLDHLQRLGVDAVWLSPIYPSPGLDVGYDVSDHSAVDPLYGTMADFDRLVAEAHRLGLRVILDLVMNHTSDQHRWFQASRSGRSGEYADWYIWREPTGVDRRGRPLPPNNWQSFFGGPAWTWEPAREQFYMHTFLAQQPELNWRSQAVRDAQMAMIRGWLGRGVDGFRLDVFNAFFKHSELPDNPRIRDPRRWQGRGPYFRQRHLYDKEQPELHDWLREFRAVVDERPGRMTVGEQFSGTGVPGALPFVGPRHLVFDFRTIETPWSARAWAESQAIQDAGYTGDKWPTLVLSKSRPLSAGVASAGAPGATPPRPGRAGQGGRGAVAGLPGDALPVLRGGDRPGRQQHPQARHRGSRQRASRCSGGCGRRGGTATSVAVRCPGQVARGVASRRAGPGCRSRPTLGRGTWQVRRATRDRCSRPIASCWRCAAPRPRSTSGPPGRSWPDRTSTPGGASTRDRGS